MLQKHKCVFTGVINHEQVKLSFKIVKLSQNFTLDDLREWGKSIAMLNWPTLVR